MRTLYKVLCWMLKHYGGCNDFQISIALAVFNNLSISICIPKLSYFFYASQEALGQ